MDQETPQNQEQKPELKYPEGFENWPLEDKEDYQKMEERLISIGIKIKIFKVQMSLVLYDDINKILKIRQDATAEHINGFVEENIFKEQEKGERISPVKENTDEEIHIPSNWSELNDALYTLGLNLEFNEENLKKFEGKDEDEAEEKYEEITEAVESFPDKNNLKEKFSTIYLDYPQYEEGPKIFIKDNKLQIDLDINEEEISDFLNSLVFEIEEKKEENVEQTPAPEPVPETPVTQEKSELAVKIENANSFDELYEVLRKAGGIQSGDQFYSAENLIITIDILRKATNPAFLLSFVTRAEGLRDKVQKLLKSEIAASTPETKIPSPAVQAENIPPNQPEPQPTIPTEAPAVPEPVVETIENEIEKLTKVLEDKGFRVFKSFGNEEKLELENRKKGLNKCIEALKIAGINSISEAGFDSISPNSMGGEISLVRIDNGVVVLSVAPSANVFLLSKFMKYAPNKFGKNDQVSITDFLKNNSYIPEEFENRSGLIIKTNNYIKWAKNNYSGQGQGIVKQLCFDEFGNRYVLTEMNGKEECIYIDDITSVEEAENVPKNQPEIQPVTPESQEENVPEWQKSEEWREMMEFSFISAKSELLAKKGSKDNITGNLDEEAKTARFQYEEKKKAVAEIIKNKMRAEAGQNLTPEQEAELKLKINDVLFEELVKKENEAYLKVLKEIRGESLKDKALEGAKNLLGTKAFKWYLGLSKKERLAVSFVIGSAAGLAFGATVAPGMVGVASYLTWRAARTVLSGSAGAVAGEWANKKWSAEELAKKESDEKMDLKNSELSLEEKSKGLLDIEKKYRKEKIKMNLKKIGVTAGAGAGIGFLTGLAEHAVMGMGGATRSALESKGGKGGGLADNKLAPRRGFESVPPKTPASVSETAPVKSAPISAESKPPFILKPVEPTVSKPVESLVKEIEAETAAKAGTEKLFSDPSVLVHEVKAGDSTWKILKDTLENNGQFKGMTEAQKTYVLSTLTNKALQHPENYGLGRGGAIHIDDKTDFTKLFENTKEVKSIFNKAEQTIATGSAQEISILENNEKIANWVTENPNKIISEDKVSEILSSKPKMEITPESIMKNKIHKIVGDKPAPFDLPPKPTLEIPIEQSPMPTKLTPPESMVPKMHEPEVQFPKRIPDVFPGKSTLTGGTSLAGVAAVGTLDKKQREQIHNEIQEAKQRLEVLEGGKNTGNNGLRSMMNDSSLAQETETAFRDEIDSIYGKSGFMGLGKVIGTNTKEWGEMARLPASKVVEYYTGDSTQSGLLPKVVESLAKSKNHNALMNQVAGLMEQANGVVKPFDNENMEQFIKRLGGYVLRANSQNLAKAA